MVVYTLIGEPKAGKTFFSQKIIKKYPFVLIFDPLNTDYRGVKYWDFKTKKGIFRLSPEFILDGKMKRLSFQQFYNLSEIVTNCLFVCEESSTFLDGKLAKDLVGILNRRRHRGNRFLFIYHNFGQIPPKAVSMSDYIIQFKTQLAEIELVKKKYNKSMIQIYLDKQYLDNAPKYSYRIFKNSSMAIDNVI
jgi:hypothetical protein